MQILLTGKVWLILQQVLILDVFLTHSVKSQVGPVRVCMSVISDLFWPMKVWAELLSSKA